MNTNDKKCPDCDGSMKAIKIVDRLLEGLVITKNNELAYTVPEAKRSFWTGVLPIEGRIIAYMCEVCGRVLLYGQPNETKET